MITNVAGWTGVAPARSHKPNHVGSNPTPAKDYREITMGALIMFGVVLFVGVVMIGMQL